jgi:hypothetical protein
MIGWPTTPDWRQQFSAIDVVAPWPARPELTGAPHYMAMVLRFRCFLFLRNRWSARNLPRGPSTGRGLQSRMCSGKVQASTFSEGGGMLQGSAHNKVGPNGCGAKRRTQALCRWSLRSITRGLAMKGVNLGFVSVFFEISVQLPSVYRGFRLVISCACRALSPSFQIRLGFDILFDFVVILTGGISVSVTTQRRVADD